MSIALWSRETQRVDEYFLHALRHGGIEATSRRMEESHAFTRIVASDGMMKRCRYSIEIRRRVDNATSLLWCQITGRALVPSYIRFFRRKDGHMYKRYTLPIGANDNCRRTDGTMHERGPVLREYDQHFTKLSPIFSHDTLR